MACEHGTKWTIEFVESGLEIRPIQMSLKINRSRYDYCRAKFSHEVGEHMRQFTYEDDDKLSGFRAVDVKHDGKVVRKMLFSPRWLTYGRNFTHIQFHDLQKSLGVGSLDTHIYRLPLLTAYSKLIALANNDIITHVKFNLPESLPRVAYDPLNNENSAKPNNRQTSMFNENLENLDDIDLDFEDETPLYAINQINDMYSITTWADNQGRLVVGSPEWDSNGHVAAPNDPRVWRYKDPQFSHGREPIWRVIVEGKWYDEPGWDMGDAKDEVVSWFTGGKGGADIQAVGYAERPDIDEGETIVISDKDVKDTQVQHVAAMTLIEEMKENQIGNVEIDTNNSGHEISHPHDCFPGDTIRLVPHDKYFDNPSATSGQVGDAPSTEEICTGFVTNNAYFVSEVEHILTEGGMYRVHADLGSWPNFEPDTELRYYDPRKDAFVERQEDGSWYLREDFQNIETSGFNGPSAN